MPTDDSRAEEAFALFSSLAPEERSYAAVAEKLGVNLTTVKRWGSRERWRQRLQQRDLAIARQAADRAEANQVDARTKRAKIVELGLIKVARAIADGDVKPSYGDLDRLVRLEGHITGTDKSLPMAEVEQLFDQILRAIEQEIHDPEQRKRIAAAIGEALEAAQAAG